MTAGIKRQETTMNRLQTCSHSHRPRKRMGRVKLPFIMPETTASRTPAASVLFMDSSISIKEWLPSVFPRIAFHGVSEQLRANLSIYLID
jgi:hypothetical protein